MYHGQIVKWPGLFNVLQRLLQFLQLSIYLALCLFCAFHSLRLKRFDCLQLPAYIICRRLERFDLPLDLINYLRVVERVAVMFEVDGCRLL